MSDQIIKPPPAEPAESPKEAALRAINEEQPYGFCPDSWLLGHQQQTIQTLKGPQTGVREFAFMSACYGPFCQQWDERTQRCGQISGAPKGKLRPNRPAYPSEAEGDAEPASA